MLPCPGSAHDSLLLTCDGGDTGPEQHHWTGVGCTLHTAQGLSTSEVIQDE